MTTIGGGESTGVEARGLSRPGFRRHGQMVVAMVQSAHEEGMMKFMQYSIWLCDASMTRRMIMNIYWWPKVCQDVFRYMKKYDTCPRMKKLLAYHTDLMRPNTSMFEVFSLVLSGPLSEKKMCHKHLLVCVEHLTGWPIVVPTLYGTRQVLRVFISIEVIDPFRIPQTVLSNNAQCCKVVLMK